MEILMEFINYIMLVLWSTFEIIFVSICPFLLLAYLMQLQRIGNFFIGTGPIWGGVLVIYILSKFLLPDSVVLDSGDFKNDILSFIHNFFTWDFLFSIKGVLYLYSVFVISLNITLSPLDIESAFDGLPVMLITLFLLLLATLWYINIPVLIMDFSCFLLLLCFPITLITFLILTLSYCLLFILGKFKITRF